MWVRKLREKRQTNMGKVRAYVGLPLLCCRLFIRSVLGQVGRYKITSQGLGRGFMRISGFRRGHCRFREKKCDGTKQGFATSSLETSKQQGGSYSQILLFREFHTLPQVAIVGAYYDSHWHSNLHGGCKSWFGSVQVSEAIEVAYMAPSKLLVGEENWQKWLQVDNFRRDFSDSPMVSCGGYLIRSDFRGKGPWLWVVRRLIGVCVYRQAVQTDRKRVENWVTSQLGKDYVGSDWLQLRLELADTERGSLFRLLCHRCRTECACFQMRRKHREAAKKERYLSGYLPTVVSDVPTSFFVLFQACIQFMMAMGNG